MRPKGFARGLVREGDAIYVFQGASVGDSEDFDEFAFVQGECARMAREAASAAPAVPTLPDRVTVELASRMPYPEGTVPLGVREEDISPLFFDFEDRPMERVLFSKSKDGVAFIGALAELMALRGSHELVLADAAGLLPSLPGLFDFEAHDDAGALDAFDLLVERKASPGERPVLALVSGVAGLLLRGDPSRTGVAKLYLNHLRPGEGSSILLFDAAGDATYSQEAWFKSQIGPKDGLWVGEGLDAQSAVQVAYGVGQRVDPEVKGARGYLVSGGRMRNVKLLEKEK